MKERERDKRTAQRGNRIIGPSHPYDVDIYPVPFASTTVGFENHPPTKSRKNSYSKCMKYNSKGSKKSRYRFRFTNAKYATTTGMHEPTISPTSFPQPVSRPITE